MLAIDNIKIKYSQEGFLPNYPPHLISDEEMCEAFLPNLNSDSKAFSYFKHTYKLTNDNLADEYECLMNALRFHIARFLSSVESFKVDLPDWVYSYMLGQVVNRFSDVEDRHYFLVGINRDNMDDILTPESQLACYRISERYVNKLDKYTRFFDVNLELKDYSDKDKQIILDEFETWGVNYLDPKDKNPKIYIRPPSMFGEQNIIKIIRVNGV